MCSILAWGGEWNWYIWTVYSYTNGGEEYVELCHQNYETTGTIVYSSIEHKQLALQELQNILFLLETERKQNLLFVQ